MGIMRVCGKEIKSEIIDRINETILSDPSISRRELSRRVCTWTNWRSHNGKLSTMSCRKALLQLDKKEYIELNECQAIPTFKSRSSKKDCELPPSVIIHCSLNELGKVEIVPVRDRYSHKSAIWNSMMDTHHYLGRGPLCGAQIRYLIESSEYGYLGCLSFSSATWRLKKREDWIGWSESARRANLEKVVCNSRFLILPTVHVPNLASYSLSLNVNRLVSDWQERYGYEPVLIETFVDGKLFIGSSYRAANWEHIGQTAGRKDGFRNGKVSSGKKEIFVYPLFTDWQKILCQEPENPLRLRSGNSVPLDWVDEEFSGVEFYDERLKSRLYTLSRDFFAQPGAQIPQACNGEESKTKAAYRFFKNKRVNMEILLKSHVESTVSRVRLHKVVLAAQDTSTLNYTAHPATQGLGPIRNKKDKVVGLILHDTMAFSIEGIPLGLLDVQCWARDPKEAGKSEKRKNLPIEEKESMKWLNSYRSVAEAQRLCPGTMIVSVCDREADIYELFHEAVSTKSGPQLLVRADKGRKRKVDGQDIWGRLISEPVSGHLELQLPKTNKRPPRKARLEIRYARLSLKPPRDSKKQMSPISISAVYCREVDHDPDVDDPIDWMLLTPLNVSSFEEAVEKINWYSKRWGIEVYHRVIKSGCRIKDRRLNTADRIETCLAIDLVVAWRVFMLTKQARETPDVSSEVFFEDSEWKVLWSTIKKKPTT